MTIQREIEAYACHSKGKPLEKFTYQARELGDNDVEIQIQYVGICGSDLHVIDSGWGETNYPVVPGHEIIGIVTDKGSKVKFEIGDRVGAGTQCGACLKESCEPCHTKNDAHCSEAVETYESQWPDGTKTYGGYAKYIRIQSDYAFHIPVNLSSEKTGPLLCAGVTVYTPMLRQNFKKGDRVGIVGMGGLGHLAVQFASAMGCHVTVISHTSKKRDDAMKLGAHDFVVSSESSEVERIKDSLNFLLVTSCSPNNPWNQFADWLKMFGKILLLSIPEADLKINPMQLISKSLSVVGSFIGSKAEINQMLKFASEHEIQPWVHVMPMSEVNDAIQAVRDNKPRYRIVLENDL